MTNEPGPLTNFTLDELFDEISSRYDSAVMFVERQRTQNSDDSVFRYHGSMAACMGLCDIAHRKLSLDFFGAFGPHAEDDD